MTDSPNLALPFIEGGELLPDVTLNEALRLIDTLVQLAVADRDLNAPPSSPADGQRWIVTARPRPTGPRAGHGRHGAAPPPGAGALSRPPPGRPAVGGTGDDNLHVKVSADGSAWLDAVTTDKSTAKLTLGAGFTDQVATRAQIAAAPFDALAHNGLQLNGNVDVSQELGTTGSTLASGTAKYIADAVEAQYVHGAGTAVIVSAQLVASSFPSALPGYSFGHQLKATPALSSPTTCD